MDNVHPVTEGGCAHPDDAGGLQHHPGPLHARQHSPLQISPTGAFHGLVHLLRAAGNHLAQDAAWKSEDSGSPRERGSFYISYVVSVFCCGASRGLGGSGNCLFVNF